jgi:hypothetical protein
MTPDDDDYEPLGFDLTDKPRPEFHKVVLRVALIIAMLLTLLTYVALGATTS